jgi:uncharacterized protein YggU (UPF0235/DUF167 family)
LAEEIKIKSRIKIKRGTQNREKHLTRALRPSDFGRWKREAVGSVGFSTF